METENEMIVQIFIDYLFNEIIVIEAHETSGYTRLKDIIETIKKYFFE